MLIGAKDFAAKRQVFVSTRRIFSHLLRH